MAESKLGPNLLAVRVRKSLNRAQEKVLQKLGKTVETKDEQFELCFQSLNKQQIDGSRLLKDVKAYHAAVKTVHEASKRLSQTLRDIYEPDWNGVEDLAVITDSEDLLWNDYEEKVNDQIVRIMENYTSQFPEVKERVAKRGRKLVDYDSARHHLEALQSAKKKDEVRISKAEEEFNKAQIVFEDINNELREELPVLYQSRIGCYVMVFQNISNLRDVFYKEMSVLNSDLYSLMKKVETQHSGKAFIVKGLNSASLKSKNRKSLVISNPIPCNTAFPADHVSIHSSRQNMSDSQPPSPAPQSQSTPEEVRLAEDTCVSSKHVNRSDSDLSSSSINTPRRPSVCVNEGSDGSIGNESTEEVEAEAELATNQSDDSGVAVPKSEAVSQEVSGHSDSGDSDVPQSHEQDGVSDPPLEEAKPKRGPVPAPRVSFRSTDGGPLLPATEDDETEEESGSQEAAESDEDSTYECPPGFLYKGVALESLNEDGLLHFEQGDVILVLAETQKEEGLLRGIREETWKLHRDLENHTGIFLEKLISPAQTE